MTHAEYSTEKCKEDLKSVKSPLKPTLPIKIHNAEEHAQALKIIDELMKKGESLNDSDARLLETWGFLVNEYEERTSPPVVGPGIGVKDLGTNPSSCKHYL